MHNPRQISEAELERAHAAAKMIEVDAEQGFLTCCDKFGRDVAVALLVAFYRREHGSMTSYPAPENVVPDTNNLLRERGYVRRNCPTCGK